MLEVPYRGTSLALTDLLGGQVEVLFDNLPSSLEYIRSGRLRPLAVTTRRRSPVLPDLPAIADYVTGYETSTWVGIGVAETSTGFDRVAAEQGDQCRSHRPPNAEAARGFGRDAIAGSPEDLAKRLAEDTAKWAPLVKLTGMKPQ